MIYLLPLVPASLSASASFHTLLQDPSSTCHATHLSQATTARARLRTTLKTINRVQDKSKTDWSSGVKVTAEYIGYIIAIIGALDQDSLLLVGEPKFTWRSTLSTHRLKKDQPRLELPSFHYELAATLLSHAICLSNLSASIVNSLGAYEIASSVESSAIKAHDEAINSAAELLCQASGVLTYLAKVVLPKWEAEAGEGIKGRPIELSRNVITALSKVTLADANLLAIRRLLSRSTSDAHTATAPGPPLPSKHPSPSLLAKLHLNVYTLYDEARSLCKSPADLTTVGELNADLRRYFTSGRSISIALAHKWLGIDAGENGGKDRAGEAIAWLTLAKEGLEQVDTKISGGLNLIRVGKQEKRVGRNKIGEELQSVNAFLNAYTRVNDTVYFKPVPTAASLQSLVPAGRVALMAKIFIPPLPAFSPLRSRSPLHSPALDIDISTIDIGDSSDDEVVSKTLREDVGYFSAGSYW